MTRPALDAGSVAREAARQSALLAAIQAPRPDAAGLGSVEQGEAARAGLAAYRGNAVENAARALAAALPTVAALLGDEDFRQLARELQRAHPPRRGDLGEWGGDAADFIAAHAGLAEWPWLADCARLDWAVHACERAADPAPVDAAALAPLAHADPEQLVLVAAPGCAVVASAYPVATIRAAHAADAEAGFDAARAALAAGRGETALIRRDGFAARVVALDAAPALLWRAAIDGRPTLGAALRAAGAALDFTAWLADAVASRALQGVRRADAASATS